MNCQARILDVAHTIPNTKLIYHTTTECGGEISKKLSIDSGDAYMNICSCCFRRYIARGTPNSTWYGWFDGSYPPEAKVRGSKWYHEQIASLKEPECEAEEKDIGEIQQGIKEMTLESHVEPEPVPEPEPEPVVSKDIKVALKARIKELQASAKPGKMSIKEIQAAFKEITNLKTQIHML